MDTARAHRGVLAIKDTLLRASGLYGAYSARLEREIRGGPMPGHIAVILDGNRRWAKNNLGVLDGHYHGADAVEHLLDWCEDLGIRIITLYALSVENLDRHDSELRGLFSLIEARLEKLLGDPRIHARRMRVKGMGRLDLLPNSINRVLCSLDEATRGYDRRFLNIALAYGGQDELVDALKKIAQKIECGGLRADSIDKSIVESHLYTSHLPQSAPDMILRTSGERRLSGFLLWQSAYSELVFVDILWPEFRKIDLMRAIRTFQRRDRREGR